ncbi:hypothetical protein [Paludisphaera rhizosphaerae]|uniref:hypothetical protein n=1 Tax=Paludisphaera rhizosphaerae TaxID=2711216 RepID=UPI0013EB132E|nr:hypothetical protein [Paludisphaera rhizosphaerae]
MSSDPRTRKPTPDENDLELETDSRFPSGPWVGYFLQAELPPGKHGMELRLTFKRGVITGEGRDMIGDFIIRGKYQVEDGKCWWTKRFIGKHDVAYQGYNEGKGIWGTWEIPPSWKGGFYIWPEAMGDPTKQKLHEAIEEPFNDFIEADAPAELTVAAAEIEPQADDSLPA